MNDSMNVPYPKDVREAAKRPGRVGLVCIDIYPHNGTRITYKGPASARDIADLRSLYLSMMKRAVRRSRAHD